MPYGVTPHMIEAYGDTIFDLSLNKQVRKGDPVRNLDPDAWAEQRDDTGLTDIEIADRIGLAVPQVTFIRCATERRLFRLNQYRKLYRLGGGLRYREDRYIDPEESYEFSADAALLRRSIRFEASEVRKYIDAGWWSADTLQDWLDRTDPDRPAVVDQTGTLTFGQLTEQVETWSYALRALNIGKGDVVAGCLPGMDRDFLSSYLTVAAIGGVFQPLETTMAGQDLALLIRHSRARAVICGETPDNPALAKELQGLEGLTVVGPDDLTTGSADRESIRIYPPVAADPVLLLSTIAEDARPRIAILTQQNLLSNAEAVAKTLKNDIDTVVGIDGSEYGYLGFASFHLALLSGAAISTVGNADITIMNEAIGLWGAPETQLVLIDGQPLEGVEIRIVTEDGSLLPPGDEGNLQVRAPSMCAGYFDNFVANRSAFTADAWFRTGRRAHLDKNYKIQFAD